MLVIKWKLGLVSLVLSVLVSFGGMFAVAFADSDLNSTHYHLDESTLGGGGLVQSSSSSFQSREAISDAAIGDSSSTNFTIDSGSVTPAYPALIFGITNSNATFNDFSPSAAATATSTFQVSDYTSYGYVVQIIGDPPKSGAHTIPAMTSNDVSRPGTEQFGINLVHNTSPVSFGANPDHGQFGIGDAAANYNTANSFRYVEGETVASAPKSSGVTTYTISYIVNVTSVTPGGSYTSNQQLVCTGTY
jgi:hypothetical protein